MGLLDRFRKKDDGPTAAKQRGDVHALDREGDPRGGAQSPEYRQADPRDVVEDDGVVMGGPGGAPQDGTTAEERREADDSELS